MGKSDVYNNVLGKLPVETEEQGDGSLRQVVSIGSSSGTVYETLIEGEKDIAATGTPEALGATTTTKRVDIIAKGDNTGTVWVKSTNTANQQGRPLVALQMYTVYAQDLADIFLEVTVNGEGVTFLAYS